MNDLTPTRSELPSQESRPRYVAQTLTAELAKIFTLVAPVTMTADQQTLWLASAVDALEDIRADEVRAVSAQVRRSITRHQQIVPKIAELVAERRAQASDDARFASTVRQWDELPPIRKHIADRDRANFGPDDWAELNVWLESQGATMRYRPDGSKYFIATEAAAGTGADRGGGGATQDRGG